MKVKQRAALEEARERLELGEAAEAIAIRTRLESELSPLQDGQLRGYRSDWIGK